MHTILSFIQFAATVLSVYVLFSAIRLRSSPKALYFIWLSIAIMLYCIGYFYELTSVSVGGAYVSTRLQYLGAPYIGLLIYLFLRDYANRAIRNKWHVAGIFVLPVICMVLAGSYPYSTLYFSTLSNSLTPTPHLVYEPGFFMYLGLVYNGAFLILGVYEIIAYFPHKTSADKRQKAIFVSLMVVPAVNLFLLLSPVNSPVDFGPASFSVALFVLGFYIREKRKIDWLPYAREQVVESLQDAFILLDSEGRFLDANPKALYFFPALLSIPAGTQASRVEGLPADLLDAGWNKQDFLWEGDGDSRYLRISKNPIASSEQNICTCIMFYDVTENHKLMAKLNRLANHDFLTGLLNRGAFFTQAGRDFALSLRHDRPAALLMLDIDHFKHVNDEYGHTSGDKVLREIAEILPSRLRSTDICGRYGGEEFCAFLPSTNCTDAAEVAECIRLEVQNRLFAIAHSSLHITVSIGVAEMVPGTHKKLDDLIESADRALYEAKESGRNRVVCREEVCIDKHSVR